MSGWYNEIVVIEKIEKHPNADNLSIATVLGSYPVVIKTGEFQEWEFASYISIDSIVPDVEFFHFLSPNKIEKYEEDGIIKDRIVGKKYEVGKVPEKYRIIKAKNIRNVYSQGMLIPAVEDLELGDSIVDALGLKKWEEIEEERLTDSFKCSAKSGKQESPPKDWTIALYDIESLRKYFHLFEPNETVILTEKLHGSNYFCLHDGNKLWIKSRRLFKKTDDDIDLWVAACKRNNVEEKISKYPMLGFFAEVYGQVKGFRYDCVVGGEVIPKLRFFDIFDVNNNKFLDYDDRVRILDEIGLDRVPELYRGPLLSKDEMFEMAEGNTLLGDHVKEGFVIVPEKERYNDVLHGRLQLKMVGKGYNLKK